jgi:hypothetical protein
MIKIGRHPGIGGVAVIALGDSRQVINILALSRIAIVTTGASAQYLKVIDRYCGFPYAGRVTVLTDVGAVDMLERLAGGGDTVMAGATRLSRPIMIEVRR